jgi:hypothetical protein
MSEEGFKIPPSIKKWLDAKTVIILGVVAKMVWDTFQVGAEVKYQEHFRETLKDEKSIDIVDTRVAMGINVAMDDANLWKKAFGNDHLLDFVSDKVSEAKQHIVDEVVSADSSKINFVSGLGVLAGKRDEDIMPILAKIVKAIDDGDILFKDDIEDYIEREVKRRTSRVVRADF